MEVENKLLPCAHCGSPAEEELTVTELSIRCVKCGVKLVRDAADELLAFQDWNTRAQQDPDPDLIERADDTLNWAVDELMNAKNDEAIWSILQRVVETDRLARSVAANDEMREKLRATEEERDKWLKVAQRLFKMRPGNFIEQLARQGLNEEQLQNFLDAFELKSP